MSVIQLDVMLPHVGQARALRDRRAWFLVRSTDTGHTRLTPDPGPVRREEILAVYSPEPGGWHA